MSNIVLCGKVASGKDYLRKRLESRGFQHQVSYTTRPPREGETNGKEYWFISKERFLEMIANGEFHEYAQFKDWYYGTSKEQWNSKGSVFIMTPKGISQLSKEDRKKVFVIYIEIDIETRRKRLLERNDSNDSNERRIQADEIDFANFTDFDLKLTSPNF